MHKILWQGLQAANKRFCRYPVLRDLLAAGDFEAGKTHILAIGKAAQKMAYVAHKALPAQRLGTCMVLTKYGFYPENVSETQFCQILEAGHPVPDAASICSTGTIIKHLQGLPPEDELVILLSGGSSALFELPKEGKTLADIIGLNRLLLSSGLDIAQMNARRREYSMVKGGKALDYVSCNIRGVYLLSDVPENDPQVIGSAPFWREDLPHHIVGDLAGYLKCLRAEYKKLYTGHVYLSQRYISEDLGQIARHIVQLAHKAAPGIYLCGGEALLKRKAVGKGGRCSHLALLIAKALAEEEGWTFIAYATDGNDNIVESSGACVNGFSYAQMQAAGVDVEKAIREGDSYTALSKIGAILPGGYTGTNVNEAYIFQGSR